MSYALRPLSLGGLLDTTFDIYRKNFVLFAGISAIPNVALLLLRLAIGETNVPISDGTSWDVGGSLAALFLWVLSLFVASVVTAATTFGVSDVYLSAPTSIRACFAR